MTKPSREFTGNFCVDEELMRKEGVADISGYQTQPGAEGVQEFFL